MKEFHFLENDYECPNATDSIDSGKSRLSFVGFDDKDIDKMKIHYQFHLMKRNEIQNIIFNPNNILVTYSMYIKGSEYQFMDWLQNAGSNEIEGMTYIDTSGLLVKSLNDNITDYKKNILPMLCALKTNNILTVDSEELVLERIIFNPKTYRETYFETEKFDINKIINNK